MSAYATMHPAEDWAETFAHYLHMRDTSQTAAAYGVEVSGPAVGGGAAFAAAPRTNRRASTSSSRAGCR